MGLPSTLEQLRRTPGMFLVSANFETIVAYIDGYDAALNGSVLLGFREWLVVEDDDDANCLAWSALIRRLATRDGVPLEQIELVQYLFSTLERYLAIRDEFDGVRRVYLRYEDWLRRQDWYLPDYPGWIASNTFAGRRPGLGASKGKKQRKKSV